ncbi:MAG: MBL fold metallo-hydrolase [Treponema sp.]|nr:MBL fold metallo-hydrolase [Treponema sp.]
MKNMMFLGLLFGIMTAGGCKSQSQPSVQPSVPLHTYSGNESEGVFSCKMGLFEVYMLVEAQRDGNTGILVGADEAVLKRYILEEGFKHSTNAFLVKMPGQNILVDTGTGGGGVLLEKVKKLGIEPEQVDAVFITHLHGDHFGSLQKDGAAVFPKAKIYLSAKELEHFTKINVNQGAVAALAPYSSQTVTFEPGEAGKELKEILPGITPIAAYGHTPGHTVYLIENGGAKFLIIGDLLHIALVQFPVPEISATYDIDPVAAASTRRQILDYAAKNKIPLGGMHIVYPGIGTVEADGEGFKLTPTK